MVLSKAAMLFVAMTLTSAVMTATVITIGVKNLDQATALQCRANDWLVSAHYIHLDWCTHNGYATK
jgi:hypothetical protein